MFHSLSQVAVKRHDRTPLDKQRSVMYEYRINGKRVCRNVFISVTDSKHRIAYLRDHKVKKGVPSPDKRGRKIPGNKLSHFKQTELRSFLNKFPKYKSHYSMSNRLYFSPELTIAKIFKIYQEDCESKPVSESTFRKIVKEHNLNVYVPKKDTCAKCDAHKMTLKQNLAPDQLSIITAKFDEHRKNAENAREKLKAATLEARKSDSKLLCFTFDLQKTQPIPYINTSVAFYKRQLWMYNLGINNRRNNKGSMFVWQETEAKRGSCEVASAIFEYISMCDLEKYEEICTFSDACGGQNRNKNIVSFFMYVCETTNIKSWMHIYLESGHSYLPNDTDFGVIERSKNKQIGIYGFDQWKNLIRMCGFNLFGMNGKVKDWKEVQRNLTFRGSNSVDEKVSWLNIKWLKICKDNPGMMFYKTSHATNAEVKEANFAKKNQKPMNEISLLPLYEEPIKLTYEKSKDMQWMIQFVPPEYGGLYRSLPHIQKKATETEFLPDEYYEDEH